MPWFGDPCWWGGFGWPGRGWGWGFCRLYPWLPRGWWAMGMTPYAVPSWGPYVPPVEAPEAELAALKAHAQWLKSELDAISQRIEELEKEE